MPWLQLHLIASKEQSPLFEQCLEELGALSVTFADAEDEPILELGPGETRLWRSNRISALFPADTDADQLRAALLPYTDDEPCFQLSMEILADQVWERCWLEHYRPMHFGSHLWVCPRGQQIDDPDARIITLDPGLAFGTGTHPTTALCLKWLSSADLAHKRIIDFGCGSGILAIAALKLGAEQAFGIDHDPQAIRASLENAVENQVQQQLHLLGINDPPPPPAHILLANILSGTLIRLKDELSQLVLPHGDLLLSGILTEQMEAVMEAFSGHFRFGPPRIEDEWVLLHGERIG